MVRIILYGIIFLGFVIFLLGFIPYRLWKLKLSFLWWVLLVINFSLICISFTQVYPINIATISFRKAIFSILTGLLLFCLVWTLNSFDKTEMSAISITLIFSVIFKIFGAMTFSYGVYSLLNIFLQGRSVN